MTAVRKPGQLVRFCYLGHIAMQAVHRHDDKAEIPDHAAIDHTDKRIAFDGKIERLIELTHPCGDVQRGLNGVPNDTEQKGHDSNLTAETNALLPGQIENRHPHGH